MKKSLLALAVAAAIPAAAQAQSNVTLYGIVDTGVEYLNDDAAPSLKSGFRLMDTSATWNGSRFGVRGVEPLGNSGMSAIFGIESRLGVDTGNTGGALYTPTAGSKSDNTQFWNGLAYVGLRGGFGELTMGRQYTPGFYAWIASDFTANAGYQNWALVGTPGMTGNASYGAVRADNSVMLTSTMGGLTVRAMAALGEGDLTSATAAASGNIYGLAGVWQATKTVAVTGFYHKSDSFTTTTMDTSYGVSGKLDLGAMGLTLGYSNLELHNGSDFDTLLLSAYLNVGKGKVFANAHKIDGSDGKNALNVGLSYVHPLSNRTSIYLQGSYADYEDYAKGTQTKVALGLNHKF
ncbi:MAG: hypothetical protein RLZ51_1059 [Pseudomonadota bacterium]